MSVEAMTWAIAQEGVGSGPKFILVLLANHADRSGVAFPGRQLLADEAMHTRLATVSKYLAELEVAGLIKRVQRQRGNGSRTSDFTVLAPNHPNRGGMIDATDESHRADIVLLARTSTGTPSVLPSSGTDSIGAQVRLAGIPEPSEEPPVSVERARTRGLAVTYKGKRVPTQVVVDAEGLLVQFATQANRRISARTAAGGASPALRQIVGALLAHTDVATDAWRVALVNTFANPPGWCDGRQPQIGDVFGERAAGHALANTGKPTGRVAQVAGKARRAANFLEVLERHGVTA